MKRIARNIVLLIIIFFMGVVYGYFVHRDRIFPYNTIRKAYTYNLFRKENQWSVGVYQGTSPFNLRDHEELDNPVIKAMDVADIDAAFVADPFIVQSNGKFYMFFEVMSLDTQSGNIGYAVSEDGKKWDYRKIILDETFHLSYPSIFEWKGVYYMIPESFQDQSVRIYEAVSFPEKWKYAGNLLSGSSFTDPTLFYHNNKFWMFTSNLESDMLNLFFSDSLTSGWQPHPLNPLIRNNKHVARPAGRVFTYDGRLYRIAQDDYPFYGMQVYAVEINELTEETYKENTDSLIKIIAKGVKGWNAAGMHHADIQKIEDVWFAAVDGIKRRSGGINPK